MKRTLKYICIGTLAMFTFSACLENEEPAGLENLRNARSEMYKSEAAYKAAEISLIEAQVELSQVAVEKEQMKKQMAEVELKLQQLEIKNKELDLKRKEAENAHEEKVMELELAVLEQQNQFQIEAIKAQKKQLEADILQLETVLLKQQLEKQKLEKEKELILLQHQKAVIDAQATLAAAEAEYQEALKALNLSSKTLSPDEMMELEHITLELESTRGYLTSLNEDLVDAHNHLAEIEYNFDAEYELQDRLNKLENQKARLQKKLDEKAELEKLDFTAGNTEWLNARDQAQAKVDEYEKQLKELEIEKMTIFEEKQVVEKKIADLVEEDAQNKFKLDSLEEVSDKVVKNLYEFIDYEVPVDPAIIDYVGKRIQKNYVPVDPDKDHLEYKDVFIKNALQEQKDGSWTLENNSLAWTTSFKNSQTLIGQFISDISVLLGNPAQIENLKQQVEEAELRYGIDKEEYDKVMKEWRVVIAKRLPALKEYGIVNNTLAEKNLQKDAEEALLEIEKIELDTEMTDEAKVKAYKPLCQIIFHEQKVRHDLADAAHPDYLTLDPSEKDWATNIGTLLTTYKEAVNSYHKDIVNTFYDNDPKYTSYNESNQNYSKWLYDNYEFMNKPLEDYLENGVIFNKKEATNFFDLVTYNVIVTNNTELTKTCDVLGMSTGYESTKWFEIRLNKEILDYAKAIINNQAKFQKLVSDLNVLLEGFDSENAELDRQTIDLLNQQKDILLAQNELVNRGKELMRERGLIDKKLDGIDNKQNNLGYLASTYMDMVSLYNDLLDQNAVIIDNELYSLADYTIEELEEVRSKALKSLESEIKLKQIDVERAEAAVERFEIEAEDHKQLAIMEAKAEIEDIEREIALAQKEFDMLNSLLDTYLQKIAGVAEPSPTK